MPVDTSIYGNLLKPIDPLQAAQISQSLANQGQQRQLVQAQTAMAQQQYRANAAMGPIMQQSVGPGGQVDYSKAATLMAQNPDTAYLAPEFLSKAYAGQGAQLDNELKKMQVLGARQKAFGDAAMGAVSEHGNNVTSADVARRLDVLHGQMVDSGLDTDGKLGDSLISFMGSLPTPQGPGLANYLKSVGVQSIGGAQGLEKVTGAFQTFDVGGKTFLGYTDPIHGGVNYVGELAKTPTPGELNAPTEVTSPSGAKSIVPAAQTRPFYNGAAQVVTQPPGGGQPPAPGAPLAPAGPGNISALGPEQAGALNQRAANAQEYSKGLQQDVYNAQTQVLMLQQLEDLSKQFKPGAGAGVRNSMATVLQALGAPQQAVDKVDNGSISATQAFQKYGVQNTMNVLRQSIGGQGRLTNLEFEQFLHANPNIDTDPGAIQKILAFSHKMYDLKFREQQAFNQYVKAGPEAGGGMPADFQTQWINGLMKRGIIRQAQNTDLSQKQQLYGPQGGQ